MADFGDELFLDVGDDGLQEFDCLSFYESLEVDEDLAFPHNLFAPHYPHGTLTHTPGAFSFDSDPDFRGHPTSRPRSPPFWDCLEDDLADHDFEWEEIVDAAPGVGGGGSGGGGGERVQGVGGHGDGDVFGLLDEREMLGVIEGIDSGDDDSIFSDGPPFDFGDGELEELDGIFRGVGWELLPVPLVEDDFEVLPGHIAEAARQLHARWWSGFRWWRSEGRRPRRAAPCARTGSHKGSSPRGCRAGTSTMVRALGRGSPSATPARCAGASCPLTTLSMSGGGRSAVLLVELRHS